MQESGKTSCHGCHGTMSPVYDWQVVPRKELVFAARWGVDLENGWYWCAECDEWTHLPSVHLIQEIPF